MYLDALAPFSKNVVGDSLARLMSRTHLCTYQRRMTLGSIASLMMIEALSYIVDYQLVCSIVVLTASLAVVLFCDSIPSFPSRLTSAELNG